MAKSRAIEFCLMDKEGNLMLSCGWLPWPYVVKSVELDGDIAIVHDSKGEATFNLGDIHLSDLSHDPL